MNRKSHLKSHPASEPIELSGVWQMESPEQADAILGGKEIGFAYRRDGHPNGRSLESQLARIHCAQDAIVTAQGMSALSAAMLALLKPGDRVLLAQPLYGKTSVLVKSHLSKWGLRWKDIANYDLNEWGKELDIGARMVVVETISNPRMAVPPLEELIALIESKRVSQSSESRTLLLVDNTFATPALCQPLSLGADLVMESLSKFVCGHGDVMLGMLAGDGNVIQSVREVVSAYGLASSPLDCWLTTRGLATLDIRMEQASNSAMEIALRLQESPAVRCVDYPGLPSHPSHRNAKLVLAKGFGNMLSFRLAGGIDAANAFIHACSDSIPFFPSLGECKTSLSHPVTTSHRSYSSDQLDLLGIDAGTIRLSVGIEKLELIWNGIDKALKAVPL